MNIYYVLDTIVDEIKTQPDNNGAKGHITMEGELVSLDFEEVVMREEEAKCIGSAVYQSRTVMEFKTKTERCFRPIEGMNATEIEELVEEYVSAKLKECELDAEVRGVVISGSRCRGLERKRSDLDVVVEYSSDVREDALFDLLHEDKLIIGGVKVDINPITAGETGTLEEYRSGEEKYLEGKKSRTPICERLKLKKEEVKEESKNRSTDKQRNREKER